MKSILVVGAASLDTLHINGTVHHTIGGAGLYTALAAASAGTKALLVAPKPNPMPDVLQKVANYISWVGPTCLPSELSQLEIAHHGNGKASLLRASWGATEELSTADLPYNLNEHTFIHIAALPSARHQLSLLEFCRQQNVQSISCGTYAKLVYEAGNEVRALQSKSNLFFMNANEANGLFGSVEKVTGEAGQTIFVTLDRDGAIAVQGTKHVKIMGKPVAEVDPTGAGDTFCGATLAGLAQGFKVVDAALHGCRWAAKTVQKIGPSSLLKAQSKL